ncbi:MAG: glycerol-3-phosphate 1-O-acyltransferase PlsY [Clostridia bacterium]|nr:glycerol-3-phosphate 1-O-acyltransferase PlsY [Clostridia bacterium]
MTLNELFSSFLVAYLAKELELTGSAFYALYAVGAVLCIVIPYLLGSLNFAIIISKLVYKEDIRSYGSGNAGATNMLRTYGKGAAAATFLGDISKTVLAVLFGSLTLGYFHGGACIAGFFAVIGHIFPIFSHFRGGKGVASAAAVAILMNFYSPEGLLLIGILLLFFVIIVVGTKYVSLGSVITFLLYPLLQAKLNIAYPVQIASGAIEWHPRPYLVFLAILTAVVIAVKHIPNLKRIHEGKESKISFRKTDKKKLDGNGEHR